MRQEKTKRRSSATKISLFALSGLGLSMVAWSIYYFGPAFLIVLVPAAFLSVLAYTLHLRLLNEKTDEFADASRVHLATVEALATAIAARDPFGVGHIRRTQIYAVGIGREMGLTEDEIEALRMGALLHDIGKLAIPDHILNKAEALTTAELEKTRIYPEVGAAMLEKVGFDYPVVRTIVHHRELWNGSGSPRGLKGAGIPQTARILAVADGFDTLRTARSYRKAHARDEARRIMQDEADRRFDPTIVSVLLRNLNRFEAEIEAAGVGYAATETQPGLDGGSTYVEQIQLANREIISLYELAREFSSNLDLEETLELFAARVEEFVPFDTCVIYLIDDEQRTATAGYASGQHADVLKGRRINVGQGATGYVLKTREKIRNLDPGLDFAYSNAELNDAFRTIVSIPLKCDDDKELVGAITLYSSSIDEYEEEHIRLAETVSRIAAEAIGKTRKHVRVTNHAMTDPMTGLPNARSLQQQFEKEVARATRAGKSFQLLMLDLDGFKAVNDGYGHKAGDEMLRAVSRVVREQLRDYDFLARYGGDEFVALVPETEATDVVDLCMRIEDAVTDLRLDLDNGRTARVGISLGAACYPNDAETFDRLIIAADKVMYQRKSARKRFALTHDQRTRTRAADIASGSIIVELDERHVISEALN